MLMELVHFIAVTRMNSKIRDTNKHMIKPSVQYSLKTGLSSPVGSFEELVRVVEAEHQMALNTENKIILAKLSIIK